MSDRATLATDPYLDIAKIPTQADLPCSDGVPMATQRHQWQMDLLIESLQPWLAVRDDGYVGGNMFLHFSLARVRNRDFVGSDFFAVLDVPKGERLSWVVWEEGKAPDLVIELLSPSTAAYDKREKKHLYQTQLRVPEYFWFDPFNPDDLAGFSWQSNQYQPIAPNAQGHLLSEVLGLALVRWAGRYRDVETTWLRWATPAGELLPLDSELAAEQRQRAESERRARLDAIPRLAALGLTVEQIAEAIALPVASVQAALAANNSDL